VCTCVAAVSLLLPPFCTWISRTRIALFKHNEEVKQQQDFPRCQGALQDDGVRHGQRQRLAPRVRCGGTRGSTSAVPERARPERMTLCGCGVDGPRLALPIGANLLHVDSSLTAIARPISFVPITFVPSKRKAFVARSAWATATSLRMPDIQAHPDFLKSPGLQVTLDD
jgi:hypothetical protein